MTIAKAMKGTTQMNKTVIEMAREAGFHAWYTQPEEHPDHVAIIERFAALVAAAEREACAQVCEDHFSSDGDWCSKAIRARSNT